MKKVRLEVRRMNETGTPGPARLMLPGSADRACGSRKVVFRGMARHRLLACFFRRNSSWVATKKGTKVPRVLQGYASHTARQRTSRVCLSQIRRQHTDIEYCFAEDGRFDPSEDCQSREEQRARVCLGGGEQGPPFLQVIRGGCLFCKLLSFIILSTFLLPTLLSAILRTSTTWQTLWRPSLCREGIQWLTT